MSYERPPPTSYRDAAGAFHPGPGCDGYIEHAAECRPCRLHLRNAADRGELWARKLDAVVRFTTRDVLMSDVDRSPRPLPKPTLLPASSAAVLVTFPRSLPARWRRYTTPGPLIALACGAAGALLLPTSVGAVLIVGLLAAVAAIHRYVPDAVPTARAIRR